MNHKPKKRRRGGFVCIVILIVGTMIFMLMAGLTNAYFQAHKTNQDRLTTLQNSCDAMVPIRISAEKP